MFDWTLPGIGPGIRPSGREDWIVQDRIDGRTRPLVIAGHGEIELDEARHHARRMLKRIRAGDDLAGH